MIYLTSVELVVAVATTLGHERGSKSAVSDVDYLGVDDAVALRESNNKPKVSGSAALPDYAAMAPIFNDLYDVTYEGAFKESYNSALEYMRTDTV
jgi:hypothetical protein